MLQAELGLYPGCSQTALFYQQAKCRRDSEQLATVQLTSHKSFVTAVVVCLPLAFDTPGRPQFGRSGSIFVTPASSAS